MAAFLGIFALGMAGWWVLSVAFFIWIIWEVEKDSWVGSSICVILYLLFMQYLARADIFGHALKHPLGALLAVLGYFVIGFLWSFVKWWLFVSKAADKRVAARKEFLEGKEKVPSEELNQVWERHTHLCGLSKPLATNNKGKISIWILYWPISLLWSLLDDFIKKIIQRLIIAFRKLYDSITNGAFANVD
jgi:hypothetical protein